MISERSLSLPPASPNLWVSVEDPAVIRHIAPRPDVQRARLKMFQPNEQLQPRRLRRARFIEILHHIPKPHALPPLASKQRQPGPVGIGLERCDATATAATAGALAAADAGAAAAHAAVVGDVVPVVSVVVIVVIVMLAVIVALMLIMTIVVMVIIMFLSSVRVVQWRLGSSVRR